MKEKKSPTNKEKTRSASRPDTRPDRKLQEKNGVRNLKPKETNTKLSPDKLITNTLLVNDTKVDENMVVDYVDDADVSDEVTHTVKPPKVEEKQILNENSGGMEIMDDPDDETTNDSVSSIGDSQTAEDDNAEKVKSISLQVKPENAISKSSPKVSVDNNSKNMKVHPRPLSDPTAGEADHPHGARSDDEAKDNDIRDDTPAFKQKIEEMETRIKNLESELREVAALEIALYSVVPEHGSSAHKVHTPARRLSRIYIYACKHWSQDKRATVARNTVSGLVLVSKSCGNDVSRLTFWLSNTVVLREIISQAFGSSCQSSALTKVFELSGGNKWKNSMGSRQSNKQSVLQFVDDWQETRTFTAALEKVESWIFSRIVESIWWQTLTPNMQSPVDGDPIAKKGGERLLGPPLGDQKQGNFSINLWKNAFHDALKRLCPVRAGGHECGCLPVLARKVMEQCIGRLDVAMFNAILRESAYEIPTDPVSDPIVDSKVLPIPAGSLCFGSGAQLKNSVGNWTRWLSDFLGVDADGNAQDEKKGINNDDDKSHSPFPSSEIYRTLPVRVELLRALLNSDLIGFHTFDYARHFLSCCSRMLGVSYQSKRGYIGLEYYGRTVSIKILPVGIHMGQLRAVLDLPETEAKVVELQNKFNNQTVLLGVDDMDIFKGITLKLLAFEQLLNQHPNKIGKVVLVQIANPARGRGKDVEEIKSETHATVSRINDTFRKPGYEPVILIDTPLHFYERIAYYVISECCLVTAVRDGMNLIPYEYVVCRQGTSMLVVSEFIGCSPSLSGAIRVNPWNTDSVSEAMDYALMIREDEKQMRHDKHYKYVSSHDVAYWAHSFLVDLERSCRDHMRRRCWGIGFGLGFRVIALDPSFRKLSVEHIGSAYRRTKNRAILLDYDGTLTSQSAADTSPNAEAIEILNKLCRDPKNVVFVVSGINKEILTRWFASCENMAIGAEHGYFVRPQNSADWETSVAVQDFYWKQIAEPVMQLYTETTDGSFIETKESALVWNYQLSDPDFGSCQAKELLDHLESVLANEPVSVKSGQHIVEVKPQGVNKGLVARRLLDMMQQKGMMLPDFVLCIGDDRSDEDMFEVIMSAKDDGCLSPVAEVFACTVGQKPSKAKYYLEDTWEILRMFQGLADASEQSSAVAKNVSSSPHQRAVVIDKV